MAQVKNPSQPPRASIWCHLALTFTLAHTVLPAVLQVSWGQCTYWITLSHDARNKHFVCSQQSILKPLLSNPFKQWLFAGRWDKAAGSQHHPFNQFWRAVTDDTENTRLKSRCKTNFLSKLLCTSKPQIPHLKRQSCSSFEMLMGYRDTSVTAE